jgi:hypothetical protein
MFTPYQIVILCYNILYVPFKKPEHVRKDAHEQRNDQCRSRYHQREATA